MRQNKKLTWLQGCFLGDVRVIWCNSLSNSHFQTYVINFVEIVIDHYLLITSHVSHAFTSCTNYSLLNLVHDIVCEFILAIQDYIFLVFNAKCVLCLSFWGQIDSKMCFCKIWVEFKCFWITFNLVLMNFIYEILCFKEFPH